MVSSNGKVELELRGTPGVSLDASTSNGDIISKLPILATLYREDHITGTIGEAVADLYIRTSNGDVTIS